MVMCGDMLLRSIHGVNSSSNKLSKLSKNFLSKNTRNNLTLSRDNLYLHSLRKYIIIRRDN